MTVVFESIHSNMNFITYLNYLIPMVRCLNKTYYLNNRFDYKWNNLFAAKSRKVGKSIYVSKYTESIIQHYGIHTEKGSQRFDVPINDGYVNHFREV